MKFMAKTTMYTATFRDLSLATAQGTLVDSPLAGYRGAARGQMGAVQTYFCFILACVVLGYGAYKYRQAKQGNSNGGGSSNGKDKKSKDSAKDDWSADKPLVFS
jgi:hypothetical protein